MITEKVLRGQAMAAGTAGSVCVSGVQMDAMLDAIEMLRRLVTECGDDEIDWPTLVEAREALRSLKE